MKKLGMDPKRLRNEKSKLELYLMSLRFPHAKEDGEDAASAARLPRSAAASVLGYLSGRL